MGRPKLPITDDERRLRKLESRRKAAAKYREVNREKLLAYSSEYYKKNIAQQREKARLRMAKNYPKRIEKIRSNRISEKIKWEEDFQKAVQSFMEKEKAGHKDPAKIE